MAGEDAHHGRVQAATMKLLDLLSSFEDDPAFFPDGLPEDTEERVRVTSILNADTLGNVLACTYLGVQKLSAAHAQHWLAEVITVFQKTVERELPGLKIDWEAVLKVGEELWRFDDSVPDSLPEDL